MKNWITTSLFLQFILMLVRRENLLNSCIAFSLPEFPRVSLSSWSMLRCQWHQVCPPSASRVFSFPVVGKLIHTCRFSSEEPLNYVRDLCQGYGWCPESHHTASSAEGRLVLELPGRPPLSITLLLCPTGLNGTIW